jgi:hypothetical protein
MIDRNKEGGNAFEPERGKEKDFAPVLCGTCGKEEGTNVNCPACTMQKQRKEFAERLVGNT